MNVVFDVGQVLISANMDWSSIVQHSKLNIKRNPFEGMPLYTVPEYEKYESGQITSEQYLAALCDHFGLETDSEALVLHRSILGEEFPGIYGLVEKLRDHGVRTATLSNNNPLHWEWIAEKGPYPGVQLIQNKWASHLLRAVKPNKEVFQNFETQTGWSAEEIVFFDDSEKYVEGARRAGWRAHQIDVGQDRCRQILRQLALPE